MGKLRLEQPPKLPKSTGHCDVPPSVEKAFHEMLDKGIAEERAEVRLGLQQSIVDLIDHIAALKVKQVDTQKELEGLCQERSKLLAQGLPQTSKDANAIGQLRYELDCRPGTIAELESQLSERQKNLAQFDRDQKVNVQKARAIKLQLLSGDLLFTLGQAVKINRELRTVWDAYFAANLPVDTSKTTAGSLGMLEVMVETFKREVERSMPRGGAGSLNNVPL